MILLRDLKFAGYRSVGILKIISNAANNFDILATGLSVLHNCFDSLIKLLFGLYPAKILDLSAVLSV